MGSTITLSDVTSYFFSLYSSSINNHWRSEGGDRGDYPPDFSNFPFIILIKWEKNEKVYENLGVFGKVF